MFLDSNEYTSSVSPELLHHFLAPGTCTHFVFIGCIDDVLSMDKMGARVQ